MKTLDQEALSRCAAELADLRASLAQRDGEMARLQEERQWLYDNFALNKAQWIHLPHDEAVVRAKETIDRAMHEDLSTPLSAGREDSEAPHFSLQDFERRLNRIHPHEVIIEVERKNLNSLIALAKSASSGPLAALVTSMMPTKEEVDATEEYLFPSQPPTEGGKA
jgi:hypothetical protein